MKLVLFDIDGTLLLTNGAGRRAITAALAEEVGDISSFEAIRFDGKTDPQIVGELLQAAGYSEPHARARVSELCRRYVTLLERELEERTTRVSLLPGAFTLLERLEKHDSVVLGLLTGNLREGAALKLRSAGIEPKRFVVGAYGCDSAHRADLPAIAARRAHAQFNRLPLGDEIVIIGDTPADMTCGSSIGARALGVGTGSYSLFDLRAAGAYATFADLSDTDAVTAAILA